MAEKMTTRLAGFLCPPGSAHNEYFCQSVRSVAFKDLSSTWRPSPELLAEMDAEQAAADRGEIEAYWRANGVL